MRRMHFQVWVGVLSYQQILTDISFVIFDIVVKKQIECRLAWHWWNSTDLGLCIKWHVFLPIKIVACILLFSEIALQTKFGKYFQIWFFPPIWGEKMAAFWACACKLSWTLLFASSGSAPTWGGTKGEFRDWTTLRSVRTPWPRAKYFLVRPSHSVNKYINMVRVTRAWELKRFISCS